MDETTKKRAIKRVEYERNAFFYNDRYLHKHRNDKDNVYYVHLDSFLIHARLICEFFIKENSNSDNLLAKDLVDDMEKWESIKDSLLPKIRERQRIGGVECRYGWYTMMHKYLAHLSKARIDFKPDWPITDICEELEYAFNMFRACLSDEKQAILKKTVR